MASKTMFAKVEAAIAQFLKEKVGTPKKACSAIALAHIDGVGHKQEVYAEVIAGSRSVHELAEEILLRAETHAAGSEDKNHYAILFFYGSDKPLREFKFSHASEYALGEHGVEEATAKSILKATLQDSREIQRICFAQINAMNEQVQNMMSAATEQLRAQGAQITATREERDAAIDYIASLRVAQMTNEHEHKMAELKARESADFKRKLMEYAPGLVNQILGKDVFPEATGDTAILKGLAAGLRKVDPQIVMAAFGQLDDTTQAITMSRFKQLEDQEKERAAKAEEALQAAARVVHRPELPLEGETKGELQ